MKKILAVMMFVSGVVFIFQSFTVTKEPAIRSKAALGKRLFNEKILSLDSSVSCASCHKPELAFADSTAFSLGIKGQFTLRNTPSVLNMKNRPYYFWDGRASSLEEQALMPIQNPAEMGLPIEEAVQRLNTSEYYLQLFQRVFREKPNAANLAEAFSAFERTLETDNSKFDNWGNNKGKLSKEEENGRQIFLGKGHCFDCHSMDDFTDDEFRNIGLYDEVSLKDQGRFLVTKNPADLGKMKTPGLRNIALTAPYMHNGMFKTLEEVVEYYDDPLKKIPGAKNLDSSLVFPLHLSSNEKKDLVAFLKTLTDKAFER